jgi:hypothetical protein
MRFLISDITLNRITPIRIEHVEKHQALLTVASSMHANRATFAMIARMIREPSSAAYYLFWRLAIFSTGKTKDWCKTKAAHCA